MVASLCSCSKTDYQNVVPANATFVAKVDVKSMAEKGDFAHSKAIGVLKGGLALVVSGKDMKQVKAYIDDPMAIGLDLSMPAYAFMVGNEYAGLTMKVNDEDAVKDFLLLLHKQHLATKPVERHELMCGTLLDELFYSYDGKTFLLLASMGEGGGSRLEPMAQQLMNQKEEDSFVGTDAYDKMEDAGKDIVWYSNLAALPADVASHVLEVLPKSVKKSDIELMTSVNFEAGAAVMQAKVWGKTDKAQQLIEEANANLHKMEGRYVGKASDDMLAWLGMGVKGEWLLQKLKEDKSMKEQLIMLERAIDIEQMLKAVDGDVAVEVSAGALKGHDDDYIAYAQLKNTDFLQDVNDWKVGMKDYGMSMEDDGSNHFVLHAEGQAWQWGVDGDDLYYAADGRLVHDAEATPCAALKAHESDIKNSLFFVYVNVAKMGLEKELKGDMKMLGKAFGAIEAIVLKSSSADEVTLTIETKDKHENFLKQLF